MNIKDEINKMQIPRDRCQSNGWSRRFYEKNKIISDKIDELSNLSFREYRLTTPYKLIEKMCENINLKDLLKTISLEYWKIGDVFPIGFIDKDNKTWKSFCLLNPDYVEIRSEIYRNEIIELVPDQDFKKLILDRNPIELYNYFVEYLSGIVTNIENGENIKLDSNYVSHISHNTDPSSIYGYSIIKPCFKLLMYRNILLGYFDDKSEEVCFIDKELSDALDINKIKIENFRNQLENWVIDKVLKPIYKLNNLKYDAEFEIDM